MPISGTAAIIFFPCICKGSNAVTLSNTTEGTDWIWLDNVNCNGTETRLIDCPANTLGEHNCVHTQDAGVRCPDGK